MSSPFYISRMEYEERPLFWLPAEFSTLEENKPVYITGSRGTGKTSLLRALSWQDRLENASLKEALGGDPFRGGFIGVYLRVPDYVAQGFVNWPERTERMSVEDWEELHGLRFSLYVELIGLQLFAHALINLNREGIINFSLDAEAAAVQRIVDERPSIAHYMSSSGESLTLNKLRLALKRMHEKIRDAAVRRIALEPADDFTATQFGSWLKDIGLELLQLANSHSNVSWHLKLCLDEAECLTKLQQKAINTVVRLSKHPITLVVAFVKRPWDSISTFVQNLTNAHADISVWNLDQDYQLHKKKFEEFAMGVTALRLQKELGDEVPVRFDPQVTFGDYSVNTLMKQLISKSSRPELNRLHERAEQLIGEHPERFRRTFSDESHYDWEPADMEGIPPLYQRYIMDKLGIELGDIERKRAQDSSDFRKKHVAALLCFCREYQFKVPYAGWRTILGLSDACIRDFLRQMDMIYRIAGIGDVQKFLSSRVSVSAQTEGIVAASESIVASIRDRVIQYPVEVATLVEGLGEVLRILQGNRPGGLVNPERGKIQLKYEVSDLYSEVKDVLSDAQDSGFVTILADDHTGIQFVLHRLFSPKFELSYRQPLYAVDFRPVDLRRLCRCRNEAERAAVVKDLTKRILGDDSYQLTFEDLVGASELQM